MKIQITILFLFLYSVQVWSQSVGEPDLTQSDPVLNEETEIEDFPKSDAAPLDWWEGWHYYFKADDAYLLVGEEGSDEDFHPSERTLEIEIRGRGTEAEMFVSVEGEFSKELWNLEYEGRSIAGYDAGSTHFKIEVMLKDQITNLLFRAIGPRGEVKQYSWRIVFKQWDLFDKARIEEKPYEGPRPIWIFSLLGSSIRYDETDMDEYRSTLAALRVTYVQQVFNKYWELGGDLYATIYPFSKSRSDITARFIEANFRLGWVLPYFKYPWRLKLAVGFYFSNSVVTSDVFGYTPIIFPQVYPIVQKFFSPTDMGYFYIKYSPTKEGISFFSFRERAISAGIGWHRFLENKKAVVFSLDYSNVLFNLSDSVTVKMSNISFGVGYGF